MRLPFTELAGQNRLFQDYIVAFEKVASFFSADFRDKKAYRSLAEKVASVSRNHSDQLASILTDQNISFGCGPATLANIERLAKSNSLAVVSGQQTGLFAGPLYTIYKTLTAIKLARSLEITLSAPVVPVFYLVSEDHDFAEVQWAGIINRQNQFDRLVYEPEQRPERTPVSELILDASIRTPLDRLQQELPESEFEQEVLRSLESCYYEGQSFVGAFACWFTKLFGEYGIVLLDASDRRLKPILKPIFAKELEELVTVRAIQKTTHELVAAGYHAQLAVQEDRPALFLLQNGRHSLQRQGSSFREMHTGRIYTVEELLDNPENLSPKAALRPIAEDTLLPTVAYVGGPGEIAYWAQLKRVYQEFNLPMPIVVPRASMTLVEPKIKRHLQRYHVSPVMLLKNHREFKEQMLHALIPEELRVKIIETQFNILKEWQELSDLVKKFDPSLLSLIEKTGKNINKQIHALEQKLLKSVMEREDTISAQVDAMLAFLLPAGQLQERKLNIVPFLVKYNWGIIKRLYDAIELDEYHHQILEL